jgi:hypothetical protein
MNDEERQITATVLRGLATGAGVVGTLGAASPELAAATKGAALLFELVAQLVEKLGKDKAAEILAELVGNPAQPITEEQLAADVARVKREFGIGTPIPPNPF